MLFRRVIGIQQDGYVLVAVMLAVALLLASGAAVLARATTEHKMSKRQVDLERAGYVAMAGLEECMSYIAWSEAFVDISPDVFPTVIDCSPGPHVMDDTIYEVQAHWINEDEVEIRSVGRAGPASARQRRDVMARMKAPQVRGRYETDETGVERFVRNTGFVDSDIQSFTWGGGDFTLAANAPFTGNLFVNGNINISGSATYCGELSATGSINLVGAVEPGCPEAEVHPNVEEVAVPTFTFSQSDTPYVVTPDDGDFMPVCPPHGVDTAFRQNDYCDGPNSGIRMIWVNGDLNFPRYQPSGSGRPVNDFVFTGNLLYVVTGKILVSDNAEILYGNSSSRIQFVSLYDNKGPDEGGTDDQYDAAISLLGNNSDGNSRFAGTYVAANGFVYTQNAQVEGLVFANHWFAGGPTDYVGEGRLWTTATSFEEINYAEAGTSEGEGPGSLANAWDLEAIWNN